MWLIGVWYDCMLHHEYSCLQALGNGWPYNVLQYHWLSLIGLKNYIQRMSATTTTNVVRHFWV